MRKLRVGFSFAVLLLAAGALGGCQAGGTTSNAGASLTPGETSSQAIPGNKEPKFSGLTVYKRYNTTEKLCAQTCRGQTRCVKENFSPVREINGYIAGQCQLYGR